jgi:hypothetical protein
VQGKKVLKWSAIIFVVFFLFTRPDDAAHTVRGAIDSMYTAADSLAQFVSHLS